MKPGRFPSALLQNQNDGYEHRSLAHTIATVLDMLPSYETKAPPLTVRYHRVTATPHTILTIKPHRHDECFAKSGTSF